MTMNKDRLSCQPVEPFFAAIFSFKEEFTEKNKRRQTSLLV